MKDTLITLVVSALLGATAQSASIVYTFSGTGSGTVNSTTFVDVPFTIQVFADTSNIVGPSGSFYEVPDDSSTITIPGIGTATFTGNLRVFALSTAVGFGRVAGGDLLDMDHPTGFQGITLGTDWGPVFDASPFAFNQFVNEPSSLGNVTLSSASDVTFTAGAGAVPEPSTALLGLGGALGMLLVRRRA